MENFNSFPNDFQKKFNQSGESKTILGMEQLLSLIKDLQSQHQDGYYISLVYSFPENHPKFHPYRFRIAKEPPVCDGCHYTLSKSGVLWHTKGSTEFIPIPQFQREIMLYESLMKIPFFAKYRLWKGFKTWRSKVLRRKLTLCKTILMESLFIGKLSLGLVLEELSKMCERLSRISFLKISGDMTYDLDEFLEYQSQHGRQVQGRLKAFEGTVMNMTVEACGTTLMEDGFELDRQEMNQLRGQETQNVPGQQRLSYSEQARKRHACRRLSSFIRLVDFRVHQTYSQILKNSMVSLMMEMNKKMESLPTDEQYYVPPSQSESLHILFREHEDRGGKYFSSGSTEPLFLLKCSWMEDGRLEFSPTISDFINGLQSLFQGWANLIQSYDNLIKQPIFDPFTQPTINGQVEPKTCGSGPDMELLLRNEPSLPRISDVIQSILIQGVEVCTNYVKQFDHIREFSELNPTPDLGVGGGAMETEAKVLSALLEKFQGQLTTLKGVEEQKNLGLFQLDNSSIRRKAEPAIGRCLEVLRKRIPELASDKLSEALQKMKSSINDLKGHPESAEDYVQYLVRLESIKEDLDGYHGNLQTCKEFLAMMDLHSIPLSDETQLKSNELTPTFCTLREVVGEQVGQRENLMEGLFQAFQRETEAIRERIGEIRVTVEGEDILDPVSDGILSKLGGATETLVTLKGKSDWIQYNEKRLKLDVSRFDDLDELIHFANIRYELWSSMTNFDKQMTEWEELPFLQVDPEILEGEVEKYVKDIEVFGRNLPPNEILPILEAKVDSLQRQLPWIQCLHNPKLTEQNWERLNEAFGVDLVKSPVTMKQLVELGAMEYDDLFREINAQAYQDTKLEGMLSKLEESWKSVKFIVIPYKTDMFILGDTGHLQRLIDDGNALLMGAATPPSSKDGTPTSQKMIEWIHRLETFERTLEEWEVCQGRWMQLEPIFCAPDTRLKLPNEWRLFAQVNKGWKEMMSKVNRNPSALQVGTSMGTLEAIQLHNQLLDQILKSLDDYLESRRMKFPRFYFMSDEELLQVLAEGSRDPKAVQPYIYKCFGAVERLGFGKEEPVEIKAMYSPEGEGLTLPNDGVEVKGRVEDWLRKLEEGMRSALKRNMKDALNNFVGVKWEEWLQQFPVQIVLTVSKLIWCQSVDKILHDPSQKIPRALLNLEKGLSEKLDQLGEKVRGHELSPLERTRLSSLITVAVHFRDVIRNLRNSKVKSSDDFEWQRQLRYYWSPGKELVHVRMATGAYVYGYEYIGPTPRLVVTPLTDRTFLSLMLSLKIGLGGALEGPSCTGKTETVKEFAYCLAHLLIVFNCFQGLDYNMLGSMFSGLAQSGGWICLESFNKIEVEVLSVLAQQLITIRLAKGNKLSRFVFEGKEIRLVESCAVFITMTSQEGQQGSSRRLPDNLKVLFRPINIMVPDFGLIAEVTLFAEGFKEFQAIARKVTKLYEILRDELVSQKVGQNYFGVRVLKIVLMEAGELKRSKPEVDENSVMIQALRKSNLPKLSASDKKFFRDILNDLFLEMAKVLHEDGDDLSPLHEAAKGIAIEGGLQIPGYFIGKVIQLHETMASHHGVILVGASGAGKTTLHEVLKKAVTLLSKDGGEEDGMAHYRPVELHVLNPKALSLGELYGGVDPISHEWRDGLLGIILRRAVKPKKKEEEEEEKDQWIVFDGPLDPSWAENMNTLLDDNKVLCLPNLERIKLTSQIHLLFEVVDLAQASPSTVSRCGIVYMEAGEMGWKPFFQSWLDGKVSNLSDAKELIQDLTDKYVEAGLEFVRSHCKEVIPQAVTGKLKMMCDLLESLLLLEEPDYHHGRQNTYLSFVFAYVWAIGGNIREEDLPKFDNFVRGQFEKESEDFTFPTSGTLFEFYPDLKRQRMGSWETIMPQNSVPTSGVSFGYLMAPTVYTVKFGFLLEKLLAVDSSILFVGERGIGKSSIARHAISGLGGYLPLYTHFGPGTSSKVIQNLIEANLDSRKRNVLSPLSGKKLVMLIDDLHTPRKDEYGSQPALELLSQLFDSKGFHDREKLFWKQVQNVNVVGTCTHVAVAQGAFGGGGQLVPSRLVRHFSILSIPTPSLVPLTKILEGVLSSSGSPSLNDLIAPLVSALISIYQFTRETFLPTPSKIQYQFNLWDLSRCLQGLSQILHKDITPPPTKSSMTRLFCHEVQAVWHGRLVTQSERQEFNSKLAHICRELLEKEVTIGELDAVLLYGDFMDIGGTEGEKDLRGYHEEITNVSELIPILRNYLDEFNLQNPGNKMGLVLFPDFAIQLTRMARILRQDRGHVLLLGVNGIGKRSMARLASYICGMRWFQTKSLHNNRAGFRKYLKKLWDMAGVKNTGVVLFISQDQLEDDLMEDINSLLVSGTLPDVEGQKSLEPKKNGKSLTRETFNRQVRSNLHIVLSMTPTGNGFRKRVRAYPSIISRCTVNVIRDWSDEALLYIGNALMSKINLGGGVEAEIMSRISVLVHNSARKMSDRFWKEMKRRSFHPPSSYLEMINLYATLLTDEREKIISGKARIKNGLLKILETEELIKQMRSELKSLEPLHVQKSQAVEDLLLVLSEDQVGADVVRRDVHLEESSAKEKAGDTQAIAEDAQKDLAEALPALEAAVKSLDSLEKADIVELKLFQKPPELVRTVMEAVCILFELKPDWPTAKILITDGQFLKKLYDFDKDNVSESTMKKLKVYIDNPNFTPKKIEKVSKACKSICMWVRAIDVYSKVFKTVEPKRSRYLTSQSDLDKVMDTLKSKQEKLNEVEKRITSLQQRYEGSMKEKQDLMETMDLTASRLRRAARLTTALASEQTKWGEAVDKFEERMRNLVGDVFVAGACITYFGAYSPEYRRQLETEWVANCVQFGVPVSVDFSLARFADPFEVRVWNSFGLPEDSTFIENGVLVTKSKRWPLMIDPQGQANGWIRKMETKQRLKVLTLSWSSRNFMKTLQTCVRLGISCLIEDLKESLDHPSLEPILQRRLYVKGGKTLMRLGGMEMAFNQNFRLYLTTSLENPEYPSRIWGKVTVINFAVTASALESQFLSDVVKLERPNMETQRHNLFTQINSDKNQLISLENNILSLLYHSEGNILDDEGLIEALHQSKETCNKIFRTLNETEIMEAGIHKLREKFRPVARQATVMYFVVAGLPALDPMYQISLKWFRHLFVKCVGATDPTEELSDRVEFLKSETTQAIYNNVARGLFEKDRLTFGFLLCTQILRSRGIVKEAEWEFFLGGSREAVSSNVGDPPQPNAQWVAEANWQNLPRLECVSDIFKGIGEAVMKNPVPLSMDAGLNITLSDPPGTVRSLTWNKKLTSFQKLLLIKTLWEERLEELVILFVNHEMGPSFLESPLPNLVELRKEHLDKRTPLLFLLSKDSTEPTGLFYKFAAEMNYEDRISSVSMGPGQEVVAERVIKAAVLSGNWVFLQNCHLIPNWLPSLELIIKSLANKKRRREINSGFRLFLSSISTSIFPVVILQNCVKLTYEPAEGLRSKLKQALKQIDGEVFEHHILGNNWRKMVFGLCFFHALIQERKQFGTSGWSMNYDFGKSDRDCCLQLLGTFCKDGRVPWKALEYTVGHVIYGGRVADEWDLRWLTSMLKTYFSPKILLEGHVYSRRIGVYHAPNSNSMTGYLEYVDGLPLSDDLEIFCADENAVMSFQRKRCSLFFSKILALQPYHLRRYWESDANAGGNDDIVLALLQNLENKLPPILDKEETHINHFDNRDDPLGRTPPLTIFLQREIHLFNRLLNTIQESLDQLRSSMQGVILMSDELEEIYFEVLNNEVPLRWKRVSYLSPKKLASWFGDFLKRIDFIRSWQTSGTAPNSFWLSSFFFPQSFLSAVLQTHSRRHGLPLEKLTVKHEVTRETETASLTDIRNDGGVLVHGLFLEAARWDTKLMTLAECYTGQFWTPLPAVYFIPSLESESELSSNTNRKSTTKATKIMYTCPLLKVSTSVKNEGNSTSSATETGTGKRKKPANWIASVELPSGDHPKDFWIIRGTTILTQMDD